MKKSFTLIELLIVLAIIAILAGILIVVIKPTEIFRKARDSQRTADINNIDKLMLVMMSEDPTFNELKYASSNVVYLSLKDNNSDCSSYSLPQLPSGWSYRCSPIPTNIDGTGWIPIPFSQNPLINLSKLPVDPINKPPYYYSFVVGGSYALYTRLENSSNPASKNDGDNYPHLYSSSNSNKRLIDQAQGLVGYWSFDEGSGNTAYDYSGNNNHGTLYNGPQWINGKIGKALSFDGVDDYVKVNSSTSFLYSNTPRTVSLWIYTVAGSWASNVNTIFEYGTNTTRRAFGIDMDVYPNIEFYTWADDLSVNTGVPQEGWIFITVTYDGATTLKVYINGVPKGTKTLGGVLDTAVTNINIGRSFLINQYYIGYIDEVRIYNRALSEEEIKALYEATK